LIRQLIFDLEAVQVIEAASVSEGIDAFEKKNPDAAILDLNMPEGSGFDIISHIRGKNKKIPVYILTNFTGAAYRKKAKLLGATSFYDKSREMSALLTELKKIRKSTPG